jgi:hypothetical protein
VLRFTGVCVTPVWTVRAGRSKPCEGQGVKRTQGTPMVVRGQLGQRWPVPARPAGCKQKEGT